MWIYVGLLLCAALYTYLKRRSHSRKYPPGPPGLPLIGNLLSVKRSFYFHDCIRWAKKYGPVLWIKLAFTNVVVLVDDASIQKYLCKREMLNRPSKWTVQNKSKGIVALNGQEWKENRRLCMQILTDLGYGKESMHALIQEEARHLVAKIAEAGGKPIASRGFLDASVLNNITLYLFGKRHDLDDPQRRQLDALIAGFFQSGLDFSIEWLPGWLRRASQRLFPTMRCSAVSRLAEDITDYMREEIEHHQRIPESQRPRCFVDSFLREMQSQEQADITMDHLVGNVSDLMVAGILTTTATLQWHLVQLALEPCRLQAQLQQELDLIVGRERPPAWEDRHRMPLTMATIWEMYRWKVVTPLGLPREASEDTCIGDHFVPKGTVIVANMWAAHMNSEHWEHPQIFDSTRFLKPDGSAAVTRPANLFPFSVGKRMCPGEPLAQAVVFLYLTSLLQKYHILHEEGVQPDINGADVFPSKVAGVRLRFLPR